MKLSDSQIEILQRINRNIVKGDIKTIANSTGISREYVGKVLNPFTETYNEEVINAAIELIAVREQGRKVMLEKLPA